MSVLTPSLSFQFFRKKAQEPPSHLDRVSAWTDRKDLLTSSVTQSPADFSCSTPPSCDIYRDQNADILKTLPCQLSPGSMGTDDIRPAADWI